MSEKQKFPTSYSVIRFQDCDPLSHLNNGMYFDYFMNAREDHLLEFYGLHIYERLQTSGKSWVVRKSEIIYKRPAYLMEKVLIRSHVTNYSLKHIEVEMAMFDESGMKLKALMRSVFIPFDLKENKSSEHDAELMDLLKDIWVEGMPDRLEERLSQIEGKLS